MTTVLPADLYGCETWYLTLREEHTLGVRVEQGTGENSWIQDGQRNRRLEQTVKCGAP
jgi:hypothetical protein